MQNSNSNDGTEVPISTTADCTTSSQTIAKPNVMRCVSCYFYTPIDGLHGSCHSSKFYQGYWANWVDYGVDKGINNNIEPDFCEVEDDEGWGFRVGKDFGCVHHIA